MSIKISIFTPTHYTDYLGQTYQSILRQSYTNWEWVILPSGPNVNIPTIIRNDRRVRILSNTDETKIGALKLAACQACTGDAFLELDHDDLLVPGKTLQIVADRFAEGAGFVYSDNIVFKPDFKAHTYWASYGWEAYPVRLYGRELWASRCFDVTPSSLSEIFYSPDHLRAWSREAYFRAGGHDDTLDVGDDHALMCKTYLTGLPFMHTEGCHYLYRLHQRNTVNSKAARIKEQSAANKVAMLGQMIRHWGTTFHSVVNIADLVKQGWLWERDLHKGFAANTGVIICRDELQYCPQELICTFFNKCYDALVPGGYLEIEGPDARSAAHTNPCFKSGIVKGLFTTMTTKGMIRDPEYHARFQLLQVLEGAVKPPGVEYITGQFCALKGQRQPGLKHI